MREMYFESLLIADIVNKSARFQKFEKGLNVVTSTDNHVGKSSLLKSLYHTFGANVKYDNVWDINSKLYILDFKVDDAEYRIIRHIKNYAVFKGDELLLITNKVMDELSPLLEKIFDFGIYLDSKDTGKITLAPPAFTFLPYYIDQDDGWSTLYGSFQNQEQYKKPDRIKSLYYHLNIYTKHSVELMAQRDHLQEEITSLKKDALRLSEIIESISEEVQGIVPADDVAQFDENIRPIKAKIKDLVNKIGTKRNVIQELQVSLEQHEQQLEIISAYRKIAGATGESVHEAAHTCPRCGYLYDDEIYNRVHANYMNVSEDYVMQYVSQAVASIREKLQSEKEEYVALMSDLKKLETTFEEKSESFNVYVRQRGMRDTLDRFSSQLKTNEGRQIDIQSELKEIKKELRTLPNKDEVEEKYIDFTRYNIMKLNAWNSAYDGTIKLLTPIKAQGTLENKIILAQFVGLFQTMDYFKTQTIRFPFVVDSPRGKEASQESSKEILSMITEISTLPQIILATIDFEAYKDNIGDSAKNANVITLQEKNKLLDEATYLTYESEISQAVELFSLYMSKS